MRIVQIMGSGRKGGAELLYIRLVDALHRRNLDQTLIVRKGHWSQKQLHSLNIKTYDAHFYGKLDYYTRYRIGKILRSVNPDIVVTWMRRATSVTPKGPWLHVAQLGNYYGMFTYKYCDHLAVNTPGIYEHCIKHGWKPESLDLIPNFVPVVKAHPADREKFATPPDAPLILWLGRTEHDKGPDIIIKAMAKVPSAHLWVAGDGSMLPQLKQMAADLGVLPRVHFLGWQDNIAALLEAADFFVCASRFEAFGNIVLEAWAYQLPIVAARSPGPEHLIENGRTGLLVANDDPHAMAGALNELLANPDLAGKIAAAGHEHFKATYSEDAIVTMYMEMFERLVAEKALRSRQMATT
jgi:glycosyltransferase involved in cell wall biosynthesis